MKLTTFILAGGLAVTASVASAATLSDMTLTPSSISGSTTFFDNNNDFNESFAYGSGIAAGSVIDSFRLTLNVSGARNESGWGDTEDWEIRVQGGMPGSGTANAVDDYFAAISGDGFLSFDIDASTDGGSVNAFAQSVSSGIFTVWLAENSAASFGFGPNNPSITISSARLEVLGTAPSPVPLPASSLLLFAGLGGLAFMRKRKAA
ncbi:VPLPA-CTERM sorting domain-containing protein [Pseudorhodobacter turbinis]|uniref:VPLPA-CTERM sorting domain-containing protein n=1 Tax=Pseudorhodobacter turbinis TaxID=2500533 RepID=A0A4P8EE85_9RHOB|nr:VPLPA-CTERM sorting domain-containing protein [Pseudorhodobacter turbinis]QCO55029.1 VPLPA-CTERM sorting domain-containing protein [Pseudorhodobacter turbinis]